MNSTSQKTNWHSAAYSAIKIEFPSQTNPGLHFYTEYLLNKKPRRIDMLIVREDPQTPLQNPLGAIFRKYNLIEYKSPQQCMSINSFYKSLSYLLSFKTHSFSGRYISIDDITLTLISSHYPRKLFRYLSNRKITVENNLAGVYYIYKSKPDISIQVIVTCQLDSSEHIWLKCLTNNLTDPRELRMLSDAYAPHFDEPEYRNFMNIIIRANQTAQKGTISMCEALYELFAPQLKEQWEKGLNQGISQGINQGIGQGISQGIRQGVNQGIQLSAALVKDNRFDDLVRSAADPELQTALLQEYHLL